MIPELRLLYNESIRKNDLMQWLGDRDLIKDYEDTMRYLSEEEDHLLSVLSGKDKEVFQRYVENQWSQLDLECQMQFSIGVAMGLRLGALCLQSAV